MLVAADLEFIKIDDAHRELVYVGNLFHKFFKDAGILVHTYISNSLKSMWMTSCSLTFDLFTIMDVFRELQSNVMCWVGSINEKLGNTGPVSTISVYENPVWMGREEAKEYFTKAILNISGSHGFLKCVKNVVEKQYPEAVDDFEGLRSDRYNRSMNDLRGDLLDLQFEIIEWLIEVTPKYV